MSELTIKEHIVLYNKLGFNDEQIMDAMCDGEYLSNANISKEKAEGIYNKLNKKKEK